MQLASIVERYEAALRAKYAERLLPGHLYALEAIRRCRTPEAGEVHWQCVQCAEALSHRRACGHRSCPRCQNPVATRWLERQRTKLLPVEYFMVTFTLPFELRALAWRHQRSVFALLLATAAATLKDFGLNDRRTGGELGLTGVLHTHSRRLDFHPHAHFIVPGGVFDAPKRQWKKRKGRYLFNEFALAKVFRARFLAALKAEGLNIPEGVPDQWTVHCKRIGTGQPALEYLSRYLYRGVISEKNILSDRDAQVTFAYRNAKTGNQHLRTLPGEDFLWLVLQHVLPKGFRRVRDYGFLHGNAKALLSLVQLVLQVVIEAAAPRPRPAFNCPRCHTPMHFVRALAPPLRSG